MPERDPKDWQFQGSNNGLTWTTLDTRSDQNFVYRYQTITYPIASPSSYRYYRVNVTQLSELELLVEPPRPQGPRPR